MRSPQAGSTAAAVTLIVLGALFLLMNAKPEWAHYIFRLWPVLLIAGGAYMLIARRRQSNPAGEPSREIGNE
jgi:peptidoglycan/LPS O-acetylase OafA/YrhL